MEYRTFGRPSADHPMTDLPVSNDTVSNDTVAEETPVVAPADLPVAEGA